MPSPLLFPINAFVVTVAAASKRKHATIVTQHKYPRHRHDFRFPLDGRVLTAILFHCGSPPGFTTVDGFTAIGYIVGIECVLGGCVG